MSILEMENHDEILLLLMDFYNINSNYTDKDLEEFIKENSILQDIDHDEISHMLEGIVDYLESEDIGYLEDIDGDMLITKIAFIDRIKAIRKLTFKDIVEGVKNIDYRKGLSRSYRFMRRNIKKGMSYITKKVIQLVVFIINKEPNLDKQILLYKRMVQKELDKTRELLMEAYGERKGEIEKDIIRLTKSQGIIPSISLDSKLKFALISMIYDIRILIIFIALSVVISKIAIVLNGYTKFLHYTLPFILIFLSVYYFIVTPRIKKKVAGSLDLRNFMWEEFPYGSGLTQAFYNIGKSNYSLGNDLDNFDFGDMDLDEMERLVGGDREEVSNLSKNNNPYSKEWEEIFRDLYKIESGFTVPQIMEVNERTEVHVINHKNIDFSKVKKKREEIRQYLGKEIYQIIPDYNGDIRQVGVEIITKPITDKYTIHDIPKPSNKSSVVIGLGIKGWVEWDLENPDSAHGLLVGGTGSGKSRLMFHLIKQFMEQDFLVLFGDYKKLTFGRYSKRGYRVATKNTEIASILHDLHGEMMRRNELFLKEGVEKLSEYNKLHPNNSLPRIVFLIDEFATFSNDTEIFDGKGSSKDGENEGAYKDYENILRVGRSAGIHLLIALQDPKAESIGGKSLLGTARNLLDYVICGRISREEYSTMALGKGDTRASKINKFGRFYINETSKDTAYEIVSPLIDDNTVAYLTENTPFNKYSDYKIGSPITRVDEIEGEVKEQPIDIDKQIYNTFEEKSAKDYL